MPRSDSRRQHLRLRYRRIVGCRFVAVHRLVHCWKTVLRIPRRLNDLWKLRSALSFPVCTRKNEKKQLCSYGSPICNFFESIEHAICPKNKSSKFCLFSFLFNFSIFACFFAKKLSIAVFRYVFRQLLASLRLPQKHYVMLQITEIRHCLVLLVFSI